MSEHFYLDTGMLEEYCRKIIENLKEILKQGKANYFISLFGWAELVDHLNRKFSLNVTSEEIDTVGKCLGRELNLGILIQTKDIPLRPMHINWIIFYKLQLKDILHVICAKKVKLRIISTDKDFTDTINKTVYKDRILNYPSFLQEMALSL